MSTNFRLRSNSKLRKSGIHQFSLPAGFTCPMAGACAKFCYAKKGCYCFKQPKAFHQSNYELSLAEGFTNVINAEIKRRRSIKAIRIHDSGDFYSQEYLNKWVAVMKANPSIKFYTYTKSLHLDWSEALSLPNFKRIQSEGGKLDHLIDYNLPHSRIFEGQITMDDYTDCSNDDSLAGLSDTVKIALIKH